jgi:hypothetical protein
MAVINGIQMFPKNNTLNTRIDNAPVHVNSATFLASMDVTYSLKVSQQLPVTIVDGTQGFVAIHLGTYAAQSDVGPSPIPPGAVVEANSDGHVLVLDTGNGKVYDLYQAVLQGDNSWNAAQQSIFDMSSNALRPDTWTSGDAAGLPMFPLVLRFAEANAGLIDHALRVVVHNTNTPNLHIWPARHDNGATSANNAPYGSRLRLKANVDISSFSAINQTILTAAKRYGLIISDQTSVVGNGLVITGDLGAWNGTDLANLTSLHVSDFEVVDVSSRMVSSSSFADNNQAQFSRFMAHV